MSEHKKRFTAVFISDLHLGNGFVNVALLRQFLSAIRDCTETLYLVGDIFDDWRGCKPDEFIEMFSGFAHIVYVRGNHDGPFAEDRNPLPGAPVDGHSLCWNNKNGLVTHAHLFDQHFNKDSWWARLTDWLIYRFSRLIHCDIKAHLGKIGQNYSDRIEQSSAMIGKLFGMDFMVVGHTHYGGERTINGVRLFNLGSWLTTPYALFQSGDAYFFAAIENKVILPETDSFKQL